jgi:hypothetical protein
LKHDERLEFWDLIKKISSDIDELDCGILFGIWKRRKYIQISKSLGLTTRSIYNRRLKMRHYIEILEKKVSRFPTSRGLL